MSDDQERLERIRGRLLRSADLYVEDLSTDYYSLPGLVAGLASEVRNLAAPPGAQVTEYTFRPIPRDLSRDARSWDIFVVRWDESDQWVVKANFECYADAEGCWSGESRRWVADEHQAEWDATYKFDLAEALAVADVAQWTQIINGKTARQIVDQRSGGAA